MLMKIIVIGGIVAAAAFFGWICAVIGKKAGYGGTYFFILGFFTGIIGIVITVIIYFVAKHMQARERESRRVSHALEDEVKPQMWTEQPYPASQEFPEAESEGAQPQEQAPMVMCPNCGSATPAGFALCASCGKPLTEGAPGPDAGQWK